MPFSLFGKYSFLPGDMKNVEMKVSGFPGEKKNDNFQLLYCLSQKQFHLPDGFIDWCQDNAK